MKKTKLALAFIVTLYGLTACAWKPQPKAYVGIEKSPLKITYIAYHKDISPDTVTNMVNQAKSIPFKDVLLNNSNEVLINYSAQGTHSSSVAHIIEINKEE